MTQNGSRRSGGYGPAIFLIVLGFFFLFLNLMHGGSLWWTLVRYWPVILILLGLGRLWDYLWKRQHPDTRRGPVSGVAVAWILVVIVFSFLLLGSRGHVWGPFHGRLVHDKQNVDAQGAKSVQAHLEMPTG